MKLIKRALPVFLILGISVLSGCDRTKELRNGLTHTSSIESAVGSSENTVASYNFQSNQSKVQPSSSVNNPGSSIHEVSQTEVKIKPEEAQKTAYTEAVNARDTVTYWEGASVKYVCTTLLSAAPPVVRPISELNKGNANKVPFEYKSPVYQVEFQDEKGTCSFLYIYIDANTGRSIGGFYTSE